MVEAVVFRTAGFHGDQFAELAAAFAAHGLPVSAARADNLPLR